MGRVISDGRVQGICECGTGFRVCCNVTGPHRCTGKCGTAALLSLRTRMRFLVAELERYETGLPATFSTRG